MSEGLANLISQIKIGSTTPIEEILRKLDVLLNPFDKNKFKPSDLELITSLHTISQPKVQIWLLHTISNISRQQMGL